MFDETIVIQKILKGDTRAFTELVKQNERLVFHIANRVTKHTQDQNDICQEVFIKVYKNLGTFKGEAKLSTWIAQIAYFTSLNYVKAKKKFVSIDDIDEVEKHFINNTSPYDKLVRNDMLKYIDTLIDSLPTQLGMLITLYHKEEFTYKEIEEITGLPIGTVKSYLFRARVMLKSKISNYIQKEML